MKWLIPIKCVLYTEVPLYNKPTYVNSDPTKSFTCPNDTYLDDDLAPLTPNSVVGVAHYERTLTFHVLTIIRRNRILRKRPHISYLHCIYIVSQCSHISRREGGEGGTGLKNIFGGNHVNVRGAFTVY